MKKIITYLFKIPNLGNAYEMVPWIISWITISVIVLIYTLLSPGSFKFEYQCEERVIIVLRIKKTDKSNFITFFEEKDFSKILNAETSFDGFVENERFLVSICDKYRTKSFWKNTKTKLSEGTFIINKIDHEHEE